MSKWKPVLEGALAERARAAAEDIAAALRTGAVGDFQGAAARAYAEQATEGAVSPLAVRSRQASLASGTAGAALFFAYLAQATQREKDAEQAAAFLDWAIDTVAHHPMGDSLYGGFPGVAFVVEHLNRRFLNDGGGANRATVAGENDSPGADTEDPNEAIDEAILQALQGEPLKGDYDLISGIVGLGVYALERLPRQSALACLGAIVERLHQWADSPAGGGKAWYTPPELLSPWQRELAPKGYYNLGLAHGVPGVIGLLGEIVAAAAVPQARPLLHEAVTWLLQQKLPASAESTFAMCIIEGQEPMPARSAWCYGDPGAAIALLAAARGVRNPDWEREAVAIAKKCARRPPENTRVSDAAICHGAAGLGHLFNRLYQATGEAEFAEAARFWLARALDMRHPDQGVGGFAVDMSEPDGTERWIDDAGFLTGATGIGLVLLAAVEATEPAWDRVLLAAVPR